MASGLKRYQHTGHLHFVTFSCFRRQAHLSTSIARDLFEDALEGARRAYRFQLIGYVVMPEHVHLAGKRAQQQIAGSGLTGAEAFGGTAE